MSVPINEVLLYYKFPTYKRMTITPEPFLSVYEYKAIKVLILHHTGFINYLIFCLAQHFTIIVKFYVISLYTLDCTKFNFNHYTYDTGAGFKIFVL